MNEIKTNCACQEQDKETDKTTLLDKLFNSVGRLFSTEAVNDTTIRNLLMASLANKFPNEYMLAYYDTHLIVDSYMNGNYRIFRRDFDISDGVVNISDIATEVTVTVDYPDLKTNQGNVMDKEVLINKLVANAAAPFAEADKPTLANFSVEVLEGLVNKYNEQAPAPVVVEAAPVTFETLMNSAPADVRESLLHGQQMFANRRAEVTKIILNAKNNKFTAEALAAKPFADLEAIAALIEPDVDYSVQAGRFHANSAGSDDEIPAPPSIFENK